MSRRDSHDRNASGNNLLAEGDSQLGATAGGRLSRRKRAVGRGWLAVAVLRFVLVGVAVLALGFDVLAVSAVACEGEEGPPTEPTKEERYCDRSSLTLEYECIGDPVNNGTGDETLEQTDVSIGGRGPGLRIVRTYDAFNAAAASEAGPWGYGWRGPYDTSLKVSGEKVLIHEEGGSTIEFFKSGSGYTQGGWDQARLEKSGSDYIYTLPEQSKLEFNSEGELVKETERNGNENTLTYDGSKQLEKVTDGDSRSLTFKYNGEGLVESVKDPMGHEITYAYSSKQLASVSIEGKERWKFEYESPHLLTKITDGRSHVTTIKYEATTHKVTEETIGGHKRKWEYKEKETKIAEPNGSETVETFNAAGEPTKITRAKGVAAVETTVEYEYEAETWAQTKLIDPNKHETLYKYSKEGDKTSEKDPSGDEWKWEYDSKHNVVKETTPEGETTTIKRNAHGEPETVERPIGTETQKTEYKYGSHGELTEEVDPVGHKTKYTYDAAGDKESETNAASDERKWKYNSDSQVTEETSARGYATKIERDERGLPTKITDPLGHITEYAYDGNGNITSETDGNKHTTKYEYNEENLRTKVEEPNKTVVETGYDAEGQMTSHTDGNKHVWEYKRNDLEQVTEEKNPLSKITKKTYEKAGNLETLEDPEKHITTYKYDISNRLESIKYSTGNPSEVTIKYNKDSKVTTMKDQTGTTENTWDKLDRLTKYKNGAGKTIEYEYNFDNQPTKIVYPNGERVTRAYNTANLLEKVTDWKSNTTSFEYNKDGQLEKTTFPSGTEETDEYAYNEADQMTETKMLKKSSTIASLTYERDKDGQVTNTTSTGLPGPSTSKSVLDENNRLIEANSQKYEYDAANNPTEIEGKTGYKYNEADELTEGPTAKYTYNEDGQRTKSEPKSGEPAANYSYNQAGNLTGIEQEKGSVEPEIKDSYTYDGNNLLQSQTIKSTKANLTWDTAEPIPILLEDETNNYIYGPENLPIEQIPKTGETLYLHHDQQGSTRLLTNTKGETEASYTYTPYGALEANTGTATTPLRYDAQYTSTDTGLIYLRTRWYDPNTAQFFSVDSALDETSEPYAYVTDDPENGSDPAGTCGPARARLCREWLKKFNKYLRDANKFFAQAGKLLEEAIKEAKNGSAGKALDLLNQERKTRTNGENAEYLATLIRDKALELPCKWAWGLPQSSNLLGD